MSVPARLKRIFSSKKSFSGQSGGSISNDVISPRGGVGGGNSISNLLGSNKSQVNQHLKPLLNENVTNNLIKLCIELCKRKQAARVLGIVQNSKECEKLKLLIHSSTVIPQQFSDVIDTNILWTCLLHELELHQPIFHETITEQILNDDKVESIGISISDVPPHHKKLMGALIPTAEALGEGNNLLAEQILREFGSRLIEPCTSSGLSNRSSIETVFVRLAVNNKYLFPYTRQFYMDAGTLEIPDATYFWDLIADHQDEGVIAQSHQPSSAQLLTRSTSSNLGKNPPVGGLVRTMSVPLKSQSRSSLDSEVTAIEKDELRTISPNTLFDKQRHEMNERLNGYGDDDEKESSTGYLQAVSPPPEVPLPTGPKPNQSKAPLSGDGKKPIFLMAENPIQSTLSDSTHPTTDDMREIFEKCCVGRLADLSLFVRELRTAFGTSSTELRNQLIDVSSEGNNSQKISWKQFLDVYNSPQLRGEKLSFLPNYRKPSDDIDDIPVASSMYKEKDKVMAYPVSNKSPVVGNRNTPVDTSFEDSELDSPVQRGRIRTGTEHTPDQKAVRRGRRERNSPVHANHTVETYNSWDSDSTGSPSPGKPGRRSSIGSRPNNQSKLSIDPPSNTDVPVFLQPFNDRERNPSPDWKRNAINTTPANVADEILDFSGDFSSQPTKKAQTESQPKRRNIPDDNIQLLEDSFGESTSRPKDHLPPSPVKKGGRRGGEARKQIADLNNSVGELDISWEELIPTLEEDVKHRSSKLHPPLSKPSADPKLLNYAVSNSAKQCKLPNYNADDSPGLRNHFRRENSEASGIGGPSPIEDLDMSVVPLDMLPDTCLSMDEVLSPVYQDDSPRQEVASRRKPKPSGMFSLTAVDVSQTSIEDAAIQEAIQSSRGDPSPPGSERSAFNVVITPKSSRANSIISPREEKIFFPDPDVPRVDGNVEQLKPIHETSELKTVDSLESMELVAKALLPLSSTPNEIGPLTEPTTTDNLESKEPTKTSIKKRFSGVLSSATKFLQRSSSKDSADLQVTARSRANSEHSLGNSSAGTLRADKDDDSVELPIGISKNFSQSDAPVSTVDLSILRNSEEDGNREQSEASSNTEDQSKANSKGIFSRTKSLTRSSSWGLKSFLGLKSNGDLGSEKNEKVNSQENPREGRAHSTHKEQISSEISKNSRPPSRSEDITILNTKPPLSQKLTSQTDGQKELDGESDDDGSSIRSFKTRSSANEGELRDIQEYIPPPRNRTPSPALNNPPIKLSSTRNTPVKKRDWDLDNQRVEDNLIGQLLNNNRSQSSTWILDVSSAKEIDQVVTPRSISRSLPNSTSPPQRNEVQTPPLKNVSDEESLGTIIPKIENNREVGFQDRLEISSQSSQPRQGLLFARTETPSRAPPAPSPPPRSVVIEESKEPLIPSDKRVKNIAESFVEHPPQLPENSITSASSPILKTSEHVPKRSPASSQSIKREIPKSTSSKDSFTISPHRQSIPANYLDLYRPDPVPMDQQPLKSPISGGTEDIHDGLYRALLYRQQVYQKYNSPSHQKRSYGQDNQKELPRKYTTSDRNILGKRLNERYIQLRREREMPPPPPKPPSLESDHSMTNESEDQPKEYYPEFILEVFPHLRLEVSPFQLPKSKKITSLTGLTTGKDVILAIYDRKKYEENEIQRRKEPLPAHIPLHIGDDIVAGTAPGPLPHHSVESFGVSQRFSTEKSFKLSKRNRKIDVMKSVKAKKNLVL